MQIAFDLPGKARGFAVDAPGGTTAIGLVQDVLARPRLWTAPLLSCRLAAYVAVASLHLSRLRLIWLF